MIAYYFRSLDNESHKPTGWIGMALAQNKTELFWTIDEFIDPYSVEIKTATRGGYCKFIQAADNESVDHETSEREPLISEDGWRAPNWDIAQVRLFGDIVKAKNAA